MILIRTASDAKVRGPEIRGLVRSPVRFDGTLQELCDQFLIPNLPGVEAVEALHRALLEHVQSGDPLFLIRYMRGMTRGEVYTTSDGSRLRATDNAPAWWTFSALAQGRCIALGAIGEVVASMPSHLFEVAATCAPTAAAAGWHIAHIFDVKNGDTDWRRWDRRELATRFIRNIHPCNNFLLPKPGWQQWGADRRVLGYFARLYAGRYRSIWSEFLDLARADVSAMATEDGSLRYFYECGAEATTSRDANARGSHTSGLDAGVPQYRASRLTFKRDVIEALRPDQPFRIVTPSGTFEMTREDMYRVYPGVPASLSYREKGTYSYQTLPKSAEQFRVKAECDHES